MLKFKISSLVYLILFLTCTWIIFWRIQKANLPKFRTISFAVPKDKSGHFMFSSQYILSLVKSKKQIQVELDGDKDTNQKKLNFIQYEARRIKYTKDTASVINITITNGVTYSEILQLIDICYEDGHKTFTLLENKFIIFGEYPPVLKDTIKRIATLDL